jgi:hypothetical protein
VRPKPPAAYRSEFYWRLGIATNTSLGQRHITFGHCWLAGIEDAAAIAPSRILFHHVMVGAYEGSWHPGASGFDRRAIPRIYLNCHLTYSAESQIARLDGGRRKGYPRAGLVTHQRLELTTTLEELPDFVGWIVAIAAARFRNNASQAIAPPHPIERKKLDPLKENYLWTAAANAEYEAHRKLETGKQIDRQSRKGVSA